MSGRREGEEGERKGGREQENDSQWQPQARLNKNLIWTLLERDEAVSRGGGMSHIVQHRRGGPPLSPRRTKEVLLPLPPQGCLAPVSRGDSKENQARTG